MVKHSDLSTLAPAVRIHFLVLQLKSMLP